MIISINVSGNNMGICHAVSKICHQLRVSVLGQHFLIFRFLNIADPNLIIIRIKIKSEYVEFSPDSVEF